MRGARNTQVAEWMADNGGSIADCSRSIGVSYPAVEKAWARIRRSLGSQAR